MKCVPRPPRFVVALPLDPARSVCLDCIVTVVDARHIRRQLADPRPDGAVNEAQQQVAFAVTTYVSEVTDSLLKSCKTAKKTNNYQTHCHIFGFDRNWWKK